MNAVAYTKVKNADNLFNLHRAGTLLGNVTRTEEAVEAKRKGRTRKVTKFTFTPAEGATLPTVTADTMKAVKAEVEKVLPPVTEAKVETAPASEEAPVEAGTDLE